MEYRWYGLPLQPVLSSVDPDFSSQRSRLEFGGNGPSRALAERLPPGLRPHPDRDNSDYVYRLADLRALKGKDYHGKRSFVRRFAELYRPEVRPLTASLASECLHVQEAWLEGQGHNETARDESTALIKALRHFDDLGLSGVAVLAAGALVGFAVGEPLNPTTFVEHFEKALAGYTGAYPFLLVEFARSVPESFPLLNPEQDLGIEGLRRAQESWHPALMVEKYRVKVRCEAAGRSRELRLQDSATPRVEELAARGRVAAN
jgi:hypothetical protein